MVSMEKSPRLQPLGWLLAALAVFSLPAAAVETGLELETTREAMLVLEREQERRLREIERLEERVSEVARRYQDVRREQRELAAAVATQDMAVAESERAVTRREAELEAAKGQARQLLRGQWLRDRHHRWNPSDDRMARHQRPLDARIQARREAALAGIAWQIRALTEARDQLATDRDELTTRENKARRMLREVERQEEELDALLARVQQQAEDDALEIERLRRNAETLERVLQRMEAQAAAERTRSARSPATGTDVPFSGLRGALPHPVDGGILHRFGSRRGGGLEEQWRGVVFEAGDDSMVRAVHSGRVVFSDWMRGYGFLVILDHGEDFLTLYGNNRELLARLGEQVAPGTVIARAGATSAVIAPGLYFELRHKGRPLNPNAWWHSNQGSDG